MLINLLMKDFLKDIRFLLEIIFLNLKFNLFIKRVFFFFDVKKSVNFVLLFIFFKAHKAMPTKGTVLNLLTLWIFLNLFDLMITKGS